jgi:alpha-mannosidase
LELHPACQHLHLELQMTLPAALSADRQSRSPAQVVMPIRVTLTLHQGVPRLEVHTELENRARDHRLRVHFSTPYEAAHASYDGHYEIVRRPTVLPTHDGTWAEDQRPEMPQRLCRGRPTRRAGAGKRGRRMSCSPASGQRIALSLLRCVGWLSRDDFSTRRGHAGSMYPTPGAQLQGWHSFDYALIPHAPGQGFARCRHTPSMRPTRRRTGLQPGGCHRAFLSIEPRNSAQRRSKRPRAARAG